MIQEQLRKFAEELKEYVQMYVGLERIIRLQVVHKNNGVEWLAMLIPCKDHNICQTIYLEQFYEEYCNGADMLELSSKILEIYRQHDIKESIDVEALCDYENVKEHIVYRLIHYHKNEEMLQTVPHMRLCNLAIVFYISLQSEVWGNGMIMIQKGQLAAWKKSVHDLYRIAGINTPRLYPVSVVPMIDMLRKMMPQEKKLEMEQWLSEEEIRQINESIVILTNQQMLYGAAAMLYSDCLEQIVRKYNANLYILPSSIHEVIVLPESGNENVSELREMVMSVNHTQVAEEEILSDSVYYYDRDKKLICELAVGM